MRLRHDANATTGWLQSRPKRKVAVSSKSMRAGSVLEIEPEEASPTVTCFG